jgi:hypothetical protein
VPRLARTSVHVRFASRRIADAQHPPVFLALPKQSGIGNAMWIIVRTLKGKNTFLTQSGQWTKDRDDAERFDKFDYAVYCRDKEIALHERRGVGVVKLS